MGKIIIILYNFVHNEYGHDTHPCMGMNAGCADFNANDDLRFTHIILTLDSFKIFSKLLTVSFELNPSRRTSV